MMSVDVLYVCGCSGLMLLKSCVTAGSDWHLTHSMLACVQRERVYHMTGELRILETIEDCVVEVFIGRIYRGELAGVIVYSADWKRGMTLLDRLRWMLLLCLGSISARLDRDVAGFGWLCGTKI